mgnify:CR=1 FL=1
MLAETLMKHSKIYAQKIKESKMNGNNLNENEDSLKDITMLGIQDLPTIQELTRTMLNGKSMIDPSRVTMDDMRKTAIHEVGHATIGYLLFKKTGIKKITCAAEGWGALGYVEYDNSNNSYTQTKEELLNKIKRSLAGIGAEEVFIGVYENGGTSDLEKATLIARNIITNFGMSDLGLAHISGQNTELEKIIYDEENKILGKCFEEVKQLILENKEKMERVVDYLLEHKEMTEEEFINVFNGI